MVQEDENSKGESGKNGARRRKQQRRVAKWCKKKTAKERVDVTYHSREYLLGHVCNLRLAELLCMLREEDKLKDRVEQNVW